ncbi:hypothetical protein HOF92_08950, partial [bacterium]|nr:hypothetical protein [bacterium]
MPTYHYRALNRGGTKIRGEISAPDEHAARNAVREQGLFVVSMGLETQKFQIPKFLQGSETSSARVPQRDLVFFTRQLSTLIRSGFKLDSALNAISEQVAHPRFHEAIIDI